MKFPQGFPIIICIFLILFLDFVSSAPAAEIPTLEWSASGIVINDSIGQSQQKNPKIVSIGGGKFIIVWEDSRGGYSDIYAQELGIEGGLLWEREGVPICLIPKNQGAPQIISDGAHGAIIVWEDYRDGNADIYAQRIDTSHVLKWKPDGVPICKTSGAQLSPKIISDGEGGAIITWYDYRSGKDEDIYAQRVNKNGAVLWKENGVPITTAPGTQWHPEITGDMLGGAIITWTDFRGGDSDIYAQRIDKKGTLLWAECGIPICKMPENQANPKITSDGKGGVIIAWDDFRSTTSFDIYAQRVAPDGSPIFAANGIPISNIYEDEERPEIVSDGGNGAIIIWRTKKEEEESLISQRINGEGGILWGKHGAIISKAPGEKEHYELISTPQGAVVVWEDKRGDDLDIYAQMINSDGKTAWRPDGLPICEESGDEENPALALDEGGGVAFVWQDKRNGDYDIFAQKVEEDGSIVFSEGGILINASVGSVAQQGQMLIFNGEDSYIIVWEDSRAGYPDIYAQEVSSDGILLWGKDGIPICASPLTQQKPALAGDGEGGAIIVWEDGRDPEGWKIYAQKVDKYGKIKWPINGLRVSKGDSSQTKVRISYDGEGGAIIVWRDEEAGKEPKIYAQRVRKDGVLLWEDRGRQVCRGRGGEESPELASNGRGGAIITWTDYRSGGSNTDIYAQRIDKAGNLMWGENGVAICTAPDNQRDPQIVNDGEGGAIITWTDKGKGGYDIYAQRISSKGEPRWEVDGIPICEEPGTQRDPRIIQNGKSGAIIVWEDYRASNWDIYCQKVDAKGVIAFPEGGVPVTTALATQYSPAITGDKEGGAIITWEDYRSGTSYNIYVQRIDESGRVRWQKDGVQTTFGPSGARNPTIAGNNGTVIAWEDYRTGGYGIYGQKIKMTKLKPF